MSLPDNKLRFPPTRIDFAADVGNTGQDHDLFPAADAQPRWDWLLMWFISLLANQSSFEEPLQFREGAAWFDLNNLTLKLRADNAWRKLSEVIAVVDGADTDSTQTLAEWFEETNLALAGASAELTFSGNCTANNITTINILCITSPVLVDTNMNSSSPL